MTQVEDQVISQFDWLVKQLVFGDHRPGDSVPSCPELSPVV